MIKAIETRYKGYRFRSRLEARWAVFLDHIGWKWEYEPEGYDLGPAGLYLPDFLLRSTGGDGHKPGEPLLWLEIKGQEPTEIEKRRAQALVLSTTIPLVFGIGLPDPEAVSDGLSGYEWCHQYGSDDGAVAAVIETSASINTYCFHKWGRPGWVLYDEPTEEDADACAAARSARFEHNEREMMARV